MLHHMKLKARHVGDESDVVPEASPSPRYTSPKRISIIPMSESYSSNSSLSSSDENIKPEHLANQVKSLPMNLSLHDKKKNLSGSIILVKARPDNNRSHRNNVGEVNSTGTVVHKDVCSLPHSSSLKRKVSEVDDLSRPGFISPDEAPSETFARATLSRTPDTASIISTEGQFLSKKSRPTLESHNLCTPSPPSSLLLLATSDDDKFLNPLHCFVRQNIECFAATVTDVSTPCPGRKRPIKIGQVGLRCIHCRSVDSRDRTKRAVCYPSSTNRVYHCVSDMKFDHFSTCKHLPTKERQIFDSLKASATIKKKSSDGGAGSRKNHIPFKAKKSQGSNRSGTAKFYNESAIKIGMVDSSQGLVYLHRDESGIPMDSPTTVATNDPTMTNTSMPPTLSLNTHIRPLSTSSSQSSYQCTDPLRCNQVVAQPTPLSVSTIGDSSQQHSQSTIASAPNHDYINNTSQHQKPSHPPSTNGRLLAGPKDFAVLNPIHCFVRNNVEVFIANEVDISAPAPGRKTRIELGQVGLRCIHCRDLPVKQRVKRAICYPPSVSSIYHSISNMKFDHFGACKGLSASARQQFADLKASSSSKALGNRSGVNRNFANSTAQYYLESAIEDLRLHDTPTGIRVQSGSFIPQELTKVQHNDSNHSNMSGAAEVKCQEQKPLQYSSIESNVQRQMNHSQSSLKDGISALMFAATFEHETHEGKNVTSV